MLFTKGSPLSSEDNFQFSLRSSKLSALTKNVRQIIASSQNIQVFVTKNST